MQQNDRNSRRRLGGVAVEYCEEGQNPRPDDWQMGGTSSTALRSAEIFDPATNSWTELPPMRHARHQFMSCVLEDGRFFVAGGCQTGVLTVSSGREPLSHCEAYDPVTNQVKAPTTSYIEYESPVCRYASRSSRLIGKPRMRVFSSGPNCPTCSALAPTPAAWRSEIMSCSLVARV